MKLRESPRSLILFLVILVITCSLLWYFVGQNKSQSTPVASGVEVVQSVQSVVAPTAPIAPAAPVPVVLKTTEITYVVQRNDWLSKIAMRNCTSVAELVEKNKIQNPDHILVGQSLKFSKAEDCKAQVPVVKKSSTKQQVVVSENQEPTAVITVPTRNTADDTMCQNAGWKISDFSEKTIAVANCIKRNYGSLISSGIKSIDARISHREVVARIIVESNGNPNALNVSSQCKGLMQLQSATARHYGVNLAKIYDPKENIFGGIRVMSAYTYRMNDGDEDRGRVAYNAGPHSKVFRNPNFDPSKFPYTIAVRNVRRVLDEKGYSLD